MNTRRRRTRVLAAGTTAALMIGMLAAGSAAYAAGAPTVGLGTAAPFAALAGTPDITNTGPTAITGDLGIHPAPTVSGFPPGTVSGTIHRADAMALQAKSDLVTAYDDVAGRTPATILAGGTLGGKTIVSGVYNAGGASLDLTGTLTLDGQHNPNAVWIFQATSDLVTASSSSVRFINGGQACNVFWQVTSSVTLGSGSTFAGTILALTSITMNSGVTLDGRALARNGTVTMIDDTITRATCSTTGAASASPGTRATPPPTDVLVASNGRGPGAAGILLVAILVLAFASVLGQPSRGRRPAALGVGRPRQPRW
jgi:Ice-binding-like